MLAHLDPVAAMEQEAARIRRQAGGSGIVFVSGNFNVLHPGHLRLLRFAADLGKLVIGLNPDGSRGITVPVELRREALLSLSINCEIVLLAEPPERFVARLKPEIVVKGKEFEGRMNPEQSALEEYGGKLMFCSGEVKFSSLELLRKEYFETDHSAIRMPPDFPKRHGFSLTTLQNLLERFSGMRVLVVGDLIVDDYIDCDPIGMSQEDPTIVVTPIESKTFIGGAGIVAAHARGLGADVQYVSVTGDDETAAYAQSGLENYGVVSTLLVDKTRPTTRKQRFRAAGKTLLRVNHLRQHAVDHEIASQLIDVVAGKLKETDLILFSDFNYGCLPQNVVDAITEMAYARGVMMAADSQASSQLSDVSRFKRMMLLTPTEREARLAVRDFETGLAALIEDLQKKAQAANVVITLGSEGMLVHAPKDGVYQTDRLPAFNSAPRDVAGAGDSLFACSALALCAGADIWSGVYLGALAAACQVSRIGNLPLDPAELAMELDRGEC